MQKVLVAVITYEGQKYVRNFFFQFLAALTYPEIEFLFVTNSGEEDRKDLECEAKILVDKGHMVTVLVNDEEHEHKFDYLVSNRNIAREYFLKRKLEWMLFLDSDIIGPRNMIEVMMNDKKDLLTGVYFGVFLHKKGKPQVLPVMYGFDKPGYARQLAMVDVMKPRLLPLAAAGLGCTLINRKVLEKVKFRRIKERKSTEDAAFFLDCRNEADTRLWGDTRVKCWHMKFPPGDKRNNIYDPRRYQLKKK